MASMTNSGKGQFFLSLGLLRSRMECFIIEQCSVLLQCGFEHWTEWVVGAWGHGERKEESQKRIHSRASGLI